MNKTKIAASESHHSPALSNIDKTRPFTPQPSKANGPSPAPATTPPRRSRSRDVQEFSSPKKEQVVPGRQQIIFCQGQLKRLSGLQPFERRRAMDVVEAALRDPKATVVETTFLGGGINETSIVKLSNGAVAVWKPSEGENMSKIRDNLVEDHQARREAAAYEVDKAMGHRSHVLPTVFRELNGKPGALVAYISNAKPMGFGDDRKNKRLALLDGVIGNLDRHFGNVIRVGEHVLPIDHGLAFAEAHGGQGFHNFAFNSEEELNAREQEQLRRVVQNRKELDGVLRQLGIPDSAISCMHERVESMLNQNRITNNWRK